MKSKILVIVLIIICVGLVYASNMKYSEPTDNEGHKIIWGKSISERPVKEEITKEEWNQIFEDYRNGDISKEDAVKILRSVRLYGEE